MPVVSVVFDDIEVHKEKFEPVGKVENNITIKDVSEEKIDKDKFVNFVFEFTSNYYSRDGDKIANIIIGGRALFRDKDKVMKDILKTWEKEKKIKPEVMTEVTNVILVRAQMEAIVVAKEVSLPSPIPLPRISAKPAPREVG